jgi:hypothetical protein
MEHRTFELVSHNIYMMTFQLVARLKLATTEVAREVNFVCDSTWKGD